MKKTILSFIIFQCTLVTVYAAFKDVNWSVRSSGMGGAFVAVADDASSALINPAGIIQVERGEAVFMYTKLFNGMDNVNLALQYASLVHSLGRYGNMGITWGSFDTKDVYNENTIAYTHAVNIARFRPDLPDVFLGANIKFLSHSYITDKYTEDDPVFRNGKTKWGVTGDLGAIGYPCPVSAPDLTLGLALKNINQPDVGLESRDIVPMEIQAGAAIGSSRVNILGFIKLDDALCAADVNYRLQEWGRLENKASASLGGECWIFNRSVGLRLGAGTREASAGVSFKFEPVAHFGARFDYTVNFPFYLTGSSGNHRGSFLVKF